jgi:soluble lytic murein transglycosylase-like protein
MKMLLTWVVAAWACASLAAAGLSGSGGAVGWMHVMPFHASAVHPCGPDLTDGPTSVCYGADILRSYLGEALDAAIRAALLRYNGCVRTPGCEAYADLVLRNLN